MLYGLAICILNMLYLFRKYTRHYTRTSKTKQTTFHVKAGCTSHSDIPHLFHFPKVGLHYMLLERNTLALALFSIGSFSPSPFFCLTSVIASCQCSSCQYFVWLYFIREKDMVFKTIQNPLKCHERIVGYQTTFQCEKFSIKIMTFTRPHICNPYPP